MRKIPLVLATALVLLIGCSKTSPLQRRDNPFDPTNSNTGGDALQIQAITSANQVLLNWTQPQTMDISEYALFSGDGPDGPWNDLATVAHTAAPTGNYVVNYPAPTQAHWFKAQAFTTTGDFSLTSLAVAAVATVGPTVIVGDTLSTLASRITALTITATTGDSLLIGFGDTFANPVRAAQAGPGLPTIVALDFGPAAPDSTFALRVKSFGVFGSSPITALDLAVNFSPHHALSAANAAHLATRVNDLTIPAAGVVQMRFAPNEAALAAAPWTPGAAIFPAYALTNSANVQEIWGEFAGDFGFNTIYRLLALPDLLTNPTYNLNLPPDRVVSTLTVSASFVANATEVRLSENPNFGAVAWQPYAGTLDYQLSPNAGTKTIYAQFRNDWTQSDILSDYCIYLSQGPDVKILAPGDGDILLGGTPLLALGTTHPGTAAAIDSVQLDLGDGFGFRAVTGTDNWQFNWNVPAFDTDTNVVLRARVWADTLMVTDVATVTVTQLAVTITTPANGTSMTGGNPIDLAGTASGVLGGAPVDSITVDIGPTHILASGTLTWTASWNAPTVIADSLQTIVATAWASGDITSRATTITLIP